MKFLKSKHRFIILLIAFICMLNSFLLFGCNSKGKYFVSSEYIIAYPEDRKQTGDDTENTEYAFDIKFLSEVHLNYIHYKCELYLNHQVIEILEDEIQHDSSILNSFIPVKTNTKYDRIKITCTGYSDEDPKNFSRLNAKSNEEMKKCEHKNLINNASIVVFDTSDKHLFSILLFNTNSAYGTVVFFYNFYDTGIRNQTVKLCLDCGYFSVLEF